MPITSVPLPVLAVLVALAPAAAGSGPTVDWRQVEQETIRHFSEILRQDTANPPGNETRVASYLRGVLEREGIPVKLIALEPQRANVVARLSGNGSRRPILIMEHMDVVGVQREKWKFEPFGLTQHNGYVYGRGATDNKDSVVSGLMLLLLAKRTGVKLDRDLIFAATAGEEGMWEGGARYLVGKHWNEIEAEFCLAEGGGGFIRNGKPHHVSIAATEKLTRGVRLVARGTAGHGSVPRPDNAIVRLSEAVAKAGRWLPPARLNDVTRTYFERLATISPPEEAARYNGLFDTSKRPQIEAWMAQHDLRHNSMIRTSISPTMVTAGFRSNVIPSEAEATLDIRALPDEDMPRFYERLREVIGDPTVEIIPRTDIRPPPPPSSLKTDMFRALEQAVEQVYPGAATLPMLLTGATEMQFLRAKGVPSYGIGHLIDEKDEGIGGAHSDDERIPEAELHRYVRFLWHTVLNVAAAR